MYKLIILSCLFATSFVSAKPPGLHDTKSVAAPQKNIVCYFASWTVYRPGMGSFDVNDVDPFLCTHINFAFIGINPDASIHILDSWESNDPAGYNGFRNLVGLKNLNPNLKVLVSMGGWNENSETFSQVAADEVRRKHFAQNVLNFLIEWNFDGFDLDWEYPGYRGGNINIDKNDFTKLLKDLAAVLKPSGYLLTAAVAGSVDKIDNSYEVDAISEVLDMINVMVYDFHQDNEMYVGHVSPLYASSLDYQYKHNETSNVKSGIDFWLSHKANPQKVNLGIVSYGRSFTLADPKNTSLYAPTVGAGVIGPYTQLNGVLGYNEICEFHPRTDYYWDDEQKVPHRVWGNQWVGYEDARSVQEKVHFTLDNNLGGMMFWSLDTDDFRNTCGGGRYPLLTAVHNGLISPP